MSSPHDVQSHESYEMHDSQSWIDTWWPLLVILFGALFLSTFVFFHPMH